MFFFTLNNMQQETALTSIVKKKTVFIKSQTTLSFRCTHAEYSAELLYYYSMQTELEGQILRKVWKCEKVER